MEVESKRGVEEVEARFEDELAVCENEALKAVELCDDRE